MVKSSIVVPRSTISASAQKRAVDQDSPRGEEHAGKEKRPRLEMTADNKQRGRRLFGVVLGTLNKFKNEDEQKSDAAKKRQEIEAKLQDKLANERKELTAEAEAEEARKAEQIAARKREEQRLLDEKREETVIKQKEDLANYLKTKTEPPLYYRPAKLTEDMQKLLDDQTTEARQRRQSYEERRPPKTSEPDSVSRKESRESSATPDNEKESM